MKNGRMGYGRGLRARLAAATVGGVLVLALAASALAQTEAENIAAARALGVEGVSLAMEGKCAEAVDKLERAEALYHAPTILGRLGECQVELGRIVVGTENLQRVVRENLGPHPQPAYVDAQERARKVLALAQPRIAKLTVKVTAPPGVEYEVTINGKSIPAAMVGVERPIDPGEYVVAIGGEGVVPASQNLRLADGVAESVALTVVAAAAPPPASTTASADRTTAGAPQPSPSDDQQASDGRPLRTVGYVLIGAGSAGVIVGGIFGGRAMSKRSQLDADCESKGCPESSQDDIDAMKTSATLSTVGFGAGLGMAVLGAVLVVTSRPRGTPNEPAAEQGGRAPSVRGFVGFDGVGLRGQF
ncbi:MAG: hypothetical protein JW751_06395 [Polyangiaceae bacterium]|nr:hypothetical protein [Polyangiaceae bacterium]